jgi:hypothetical protein
VLLVATIVYVVFVWRASAVIDGHRTFTLFDDAMISMRYGRNFVDGHGLVFNAGQHVEGYTNLLWTLLMAGLQTVVRPRIVAPGAVSLVGVAVLVANLLVIRAFARRLSRVSWVPTVAMASVAFSYCLTFWTLRGMEVGLLSLTLTAAAYLVFKADGRPTPRNAVAITTLLGVAIFTRDDATVVCIVILAFLIAGVGKTDRRAVAVSAVGGLVVVVCLRLAIRWAMYGELVPNTYVLKVEGIPRQLLLERGLLGLGYVLAFGFAIPVALALLAYRRTDTRMVRRGVLLLGTMVGAQVAYSVVVGGDAWEDLGFANRFLATVVGPLSILAALGVATLARERVTRRSLALMSVPLLGALVFLLVAPRFTRYFQLGDLSGSHQSARIELLLAIVVVVLVAATFAGRTRLIAVVGVTVLLVAGPNLLPFDSWFRSNQQTQTADVAWARYGVREKVATTPDATIAAASVGNVGYFSERRIVDLLGKTDPTIARRHARTDFWMLPGHLRWDYRHSIVALQPDVVAELFQPTHSDIAEVEAAGYLFVATSNGEAPSFVRADSRRVDRQLNKRAASAAP